MMRLPYKDGDSSSGLDACFLGIPMDWGTCNRPGTRFGPRAIRCESSLLRPYNTATGAAPFESLQVRSVFGRCCNIDNQELCHFFLYNKLLASYSLSF